MCRMGTKQKNYSANSSDYKLLEEIGHGASATVYRAIYLPFNEVVAIKCLDLDRCNSNLDDIRREAQTMSLIDHPNVVRSFCSFVVEQYLWVVMPFMAEGSCLHLMKIAYPDGFEEAAIGSILKETLKALEYLHRQGHIHRDVKAGNILLDTNGVVKLADLGVSACMFERCDRQRARNTFVGTPCWMAPEVLQPGSGYNSKADIWSFGITALELAHGHAPFSKYPPMKVLLMTIQNAPPGLDYDRDKRFSKAFKEVVAMCLVKDQTKRPTAEKLLKHSFFRQAKPPELSVKNLFSDLPPLWNRVKALQLKDAAQLALKRMPSAEEEAISMSEYQRGVSAWNFDIDDLKAQASLVRDDEDISETKDEQETTRLFLGDKDASSCRSSMQKLNLNNELLESESRGQRGTVALQQAVVLNGKGKVLENGNQESGSEGKNYSKNNGTSTEVVVSTAEKEMVPAKNKAHTVKSLQTQSGPLVPGTVVSPSYLERGSMYERAENEIKPKTEKVYHEAKRAPSFSSPLMLPNRASANSSAPIRSSSGFRDSLDDKSKGNLVQIKGRFSVTSGNLDLAKHTSQTPKDCSNNNLSASLLMPRLQNLFLQTSIQQELIANLINSVQPAEVANAAHSGKLPPVPPSSESNGSITTATSERERLLISKISELQARMTDLTDELTAEKYKYIRLQQTVSALEENRSRRDGMPETRD